MKCEEWAAAEPPLTEKEGRPAAESPGTVTGKTEGVKTGDNKKRYKNEI